MFIIKNDTYYGLLPSLILNQNKQIVFECSSWVSLSVWNNLFHLTSILPPSQHTPHTPFPTQNSTPLSWAVPQWCDTEGVLSEPSWMTWSLTEGIDNEKSVILWYSYIYSIYNEICVLLESSQILSSSKYNTSLIIQYIFTLSSNETIQLSETAQLLKKWIFLLKPLSFLSLRWDIPPY